MPRNPIELSSDGEALFRSLAKQGCKPPQISKRMKAAGFPISTSTAARRLPDILGQVKAARAERMGASSEAETLPSSPDAIPEGTDLATLEKWLQTAERMGEIAEAEGDLSALAAAGRLSASLLEAKRKATPPARPDPNENPDLQKLGAQVAERLHKMIDQVTT